MATALAPVTLHADAPVNRKLTEEDKLALHRQMVRIRAFEQLSLQHYQGGKMAGFLHLYIGQESVAVGTISLLGENDHIITAYRDHGHALAVGMSMNECMAELFGKATGCSKGKGGSMHYFAPDKNYWGGHGIVAGQTPLGLGLAYGLKYKGIRGAALCYLGDGAVNQGAFHESLNLAALFDLPVIFVIENNGYSMGTSQHRSSAFKSCLAERASGYDIDWELFSGEDIYEVRARTQIAVERAHNESRPSVLEIATYRWEGHSVADANKLKYRTKEEVERHQQQHDPIQIWKRHLLAERVATEDELKQMDREAFKEAEEAAEFAKSSPFPEPESIFEDVYWEVDNRTESGRTGRHFFND
ncbi:MAG: pyruvate dehydrogenase (acetyl-transferring) E1 component subunit alpha [Verrucomicrobiaceae bacterium]|nr:pyruvate dehydrogenase (acetyl-transferring) E1 component subunit alpha [Verrucomicrobiaceae bacterium]